MIQTPSSSATPLRVFCLEDNPLIVFHLEQMIEDLGHVFAGSLASFEDLQASGSELVMDCALVDIDLADGPTGPEAMSWLVGRGIPSAYVTGQEEIAAIHSKLATGVVVKPVSEESLAAVLHLFRNSIPT